MTKMQNVMNPCSIDEKFFEEGFQLNAAANPTIVHRKDDTARPFISDRDVWKNYSDDELYEIDKAVREWIQIMSGNSSWFHNWKRRRYDFRAFWWCVFGTDSREDQLAVRNRMKISHLFSYYSSSVRSGYSGAKWAMADHPKKMYVVSPRRGKAEPFSLRLRLEWFEERGIEPTFKNMKLPKPLADMSSRYPETQANINKRRAQCQKQWIEQYGDKYDKEYKRQKWRESQERAAKAGQCGSGTDEEGLSKRDAG